MKRLRLRRLGFYVVVSARVACMVGVSCASPLTVAEERDASVVVGPPEAAPAPFGEAGDASGDALDELPPVSDPVDAADAAEPSDSASETGD